MINNFLFWSLLIGIILANFQDIKRREIDNWLNLLIFITGAIYLLTTSILTKNCLLLFYFLITFIGIFLLSNILYYSNTFAGGDYNLLIALTPFFVKENINLIISNIILYLFLLIFSGSIYGIIYSSYLYLKNKKMVNKKLKQEFKKIKLKWFFVASIITIPLFLINFILILIPIIIILAPTLYLIAKILQEIALTKKINTKDLKQGDWLAKDIKLKNNQIIKSDFQGITNEQIKTLQKQKKQITIKEGIPFAPAFLIAYLLYFFFYGSLINYLIFLF